MQQLKAFSFWLSKGFALSHRTAAFLHGFARFDEGPLDAICVRNVRKRRGATVHRVDAIPKKDFASVEGLCVTSVTRTILDLCGSLSGNDLRAMVDEALRRKWTTLDRLESTLEKSGRRPGLNALAALVHEYQGGDGPTESELEALALELIEMAGLPRPVKQRVIKVNGRVRRIDFFFEQYGVMLELDGFAFHASPKSFEEDRKRNNALVLRGYDVLHWTWRSIHDDPEARIMELTQCLARKA